MTQKIPPQFQLNVAPVAAREAVILVAKARFTVLTSRLLRLEYSPSEQFQDLPSQAFWYRLQPVPEFNIIKTDELLEIDTAYLHLIYRFNSTGFDRSTLSILVKSTGVTWHYGDRYRRAHNLYGTARTLDRANGQVDLEPGLNSRAGWSVVNDSKSLVFNSDSWLEQRAHPENLDLYFFGYGHDYVSTVKDFQKVSGETPLIPRFILGNWWSRYWAYTDDELKALMDEFQAHDTPLSVCIVDMDWHITKTGNASSGWTGYTWNRDLFPDPAAFIQWLHSKGLKTALNLHPAEGIYPHEEQYLQFAAWMGVDPATQEPIDFDISDPHFTEGYFDILHHPYEQMGVDFWWMDWQQGSFSRLPGLDPLWWVNHLHFQDLGRDGKKRPFIFSRWGGLGNHRYPIGFSGDTVISWESLANQPAFTSTAANVGYGWWSHDIGGHMGGIEDDELYIRWIQYGVFSPILRMHCTNNPFHERRPWKRGPAAESEATTALQLRHQLIPYIYSMAWRNHHAGIPMITPLYFTHPEQEGAYECIWQEYWFGSELVAAPFIIPHDPETGLTRQRIWLPDGDWFNFFTGEYIHGGGWQVVYGDLETIPVYARAGAIVPLGSKAGWGGIENPASLEVHLCAGASNQFDLYEDDGETNDYRQGKYALTTISLDWQDSLASIQVAPVKGDRSVIPAQREYRFCLHGFVQPDKIEVQINSISQSITTTYDKVTEMLALDPVTLASSDPFILKLTSQSSMLSKRDRRVENLNRALYALKIDTWTKAEIASNLPDLISGKKSLLEYPELKDVHISVLTNLLRL